jgi:dihydroneopterin aldolase / 2-amino-4-hydroxy-6-hydroxymethyldihydropteridine diphosphokinase
MTKYHTAYIGMGSNLGDRQMFIAYAIRRLSRLEHSRLKSLSALYASQPVGVNSEVPFLNMVAEIRTSLSPKELMKKLFEIEKDAGRTRQGKKSARVLDLDILFFDTVVLNSKSLVIPHPELHKRRFVVQPMMDINPDFTHPILKKKISDIFRELSDDHWVVKL